MKKISIFVLLLCFAISLLSCSSRTIHTRKITVLLDWTPNTNHTGLYVAKKMGYDKKRGIEFDIVSSSEGGVAQLVAASKAEVGFSYQEEVTYAMPCWA